MTHLLYSSVMLSGFYAVYWFCLRTLTFHTLNRWYLLFALIASVLIPVMPGIPVTSVVNNSFLLSMEQAEPETFLGFTTASWLKTLGYAYGIGVGLSVLQLLGGIIRVSLQIRNATAIRWKRLYVLPTGHTTASFFHWVFMDDSTLSPKEKEIVLTHEYEHFRRLHSLDLLVVEITRCFFWFHPAVYWLRRSLIQIHEYEVDASLAEQYGAKPYAQTLLTLAVSQQRTLTHSFARHPIKNRIETLFQTPSTSMKKTLFLLTLPLTVLSMALFAQEVPKPPPPPPLPRKSRVVAPPPPPPLLEKSTIVEPPPPLIGKSTVIAPPPPPPMIEKSTVVAPLPPPPPPRKKSWKKIPGKSGSKS